MAQFEWDPEKARTNEKKHGIAFEDAIRVFEDPHALFEPDRVDESGELRWHALGMVGGVAMILVVHTIREGDETIRIISARRAARKERNRYEQTRAHHAG